MDQEDAVKAHQDPLCSNGSPQVIPLHIPVLSPREPLQEGQLAADEGGVRQPEVGTLKARQHSEISICHKHLPESSKDGSLPWGTSELLLSCQTTEAGMVTAACKTRPCCWLRLFLKLCLVLCNVGLPVFIFASVNSW